MKRLKVLLLLIAILIIMSMHISCSSGSATESVSCGATTISYKTDVGLGSRVRGHRQSKVNHHLLDQDRSE